MIEIRGTFYRDGSDWLPDGAGVHLQLKHDDPNAALKHIRNGGEIVHDTSVAPIYYVELRCGVIPLKTHIPANDEIEPAGSYYTIEASYPTGGGQRHTFYESDGPIILQGDGPVDIGMPPRERTLRPITLPKRRPMPSTPQGVNRIGFFGGVIHCPTNIDESIASPGHGFAVLSFTLPFSAFVSRVSIMVTDGVSSDTRIALYDAVTGQQRCAAAIDTRHAGVATGVFDAPVTLDAGEYLMVWNCPVKARVFAGDCMTPFEIANSAGGGVLAGAVYPPGGVLPDVLNVADIVPYSSSSRISAPLCMPILAYFKA